MLIRLVHDVLDDEKWTYIERLKERDRSMVNEKEPSATDKGVFNMMLIDTEIY